MDKAEFKQCVRSWASKLNVEIASIAVRSMKSKRASCSTKGNLNFSTELLELEDELCDYVIVHELLHITVPNHGKLWKSLMMAHLGDYQELERRLNSVSCVDG